MLRTVKEIIIRILIMLLLIISEAMLIREIKSMNIKMIIVMIIKNIDNKNNDN